jgi:outer membrane protein assembly factor BamB
VAGVRPSDGKLLWRFARGSAIAAIPTPVCFDDHVYVASGYGAGCTLLKITGSQDGLEAAQVYSNKNMTNHHGGVVLLDGYIYGHCDGKGWLCQDVKTGKIKWQQPRALPKGSITCADGMLYCYSENDGTIMLVEASPEKPFKAHGRFRIPEASKLPRPSKQPAKNVWTHPVVANGRLYLRDQEYLFCFDVRDNR